MYRKPFPQTAGILMGTNCAPFLADLFLYSYENDLLAKLIKKGKRKLARKFNLSYPYTYVLISFNNKRFKEFISDICPKELIIFETTESTSLASYLDLFSHCKLSLYVKQYSISTSPWCLCISAHSLCPLLLKL